MKHGISQRQALSRKAEMVGCELLPSKGTMTVIQFLTSGDPFLRGYQLSWEETNELLDNLADEKGVTLPEWKSLQDA